MHPMRYNPEFLLMNVLIIVMASLCCATRTVGAVRDAGFVLVILGVMNLFSKDDFLPRRWSIALSVVLILLGAGVLVWYFTGGRDMLHPLVDTQGWLERLWGSIVE